MYPFKSYVISKKFYTSKQEGSPIHYDSSMTLLNSTPILTFHFVSDKTVDSVFYHSQLNVINSVEECPRSFKKSFRL